MDSSVRYSSSPAISTICLAVELSPGGFSTNESAARADPDRTSSTAALQKKHDLIFSTLSDLRRRLASWRRIRSVITDRESLQTIRGSRVSLHLMSINSRKPGSSRAIVRLNGQRHLTDCLCTAFRRNDGHSSAVELSQTVKEYESPQSTQGRPDDNQRGTFTTRERWMRVAES